MFSLIFPSHDNGKRFNTSFIETLPLIALLDVYLLYVISTTWGDKGERDICIY